MPLFLAYIVIGFVDIVGVFIAYIKIDFGLENNLAQLVPAITNIIQSSL